jgi:hypothetical protein
MMFDCQDEVLPWSAITWIASKFGSPLRRFVGSSAAIDDTVRPARWRQHDRLTTLARENREGRRGNEILRSAAAPRGGVARRPADNPIKSMSTRSKATRSVRNAGRPGPRTMTRRRGRPRRATFYADATAAASARHGSGILARQDSEWFGERASRQARSCQRLDGTALLTLEA